LAALNKQAKNPGTLWFTTDEGAIYLDINTSANGRVRFGDYVIVDNVAALPEAGHAYATALYYAKAENVLARWDSTTGSWVQLNTPSFHEIAVVGDGNVFSGATVETKNGKKILTFSTQSVATSENLAELQTAVTANTNRFVGMESEATVISYVTGVKTELEGKITSASELAQKGVDDAAAAAALGQQGIDAAGAVASDLAELDTEVDGIAGRLTTAEGTISTLSGQVGTGTVDERIEAAKTAVLGEAGYAQTVKSAYDAAQTAIGDASDAMGKATENAGLIGELDTRVTANEGAIGTLNTNVGVLMGEATVDGSVKHTVAAEIAKVVASAPDDFDTLKEIADWIANDTTGAAAMSNDIAALKQLVSDGENSQANQIAGLDTRIESVEGRMTTAEGRLDGIDGEITGIKNAYANADTALENKLVGDAEEYKTLGAAEDAIKANFTKIGEIEGDLGELATTVASNKSDLDGEISGIKGRLDTAEADITDLKKIRDEFANADTALENKLVGDAETYKTFGAAEDAIQANATKLGELETALGVAQAQLKWEVFE
jgi:predicted  nucleic acid-binding Zn-ribbon protein